MPTYEYECQNCGHKFELLRSMNAKPVKDCPKCKKGAVKRLISSGVGIIFKGSGFYQTDYKNKKKEKPATKCESAGKKPECSSCPAATKKND